LGVRVVIAFEFATAGRIVFGAGKFNDAGQIAASFGKRVLLVTGGKSTDDPADRLMRDLRGRGASVERFSVKGEPDLAIIQQAVEAAKAMGAEVVIGLGGGAAMDSAKAVAALLTNPGDITDYLEVVGKGQQTQIASAPCICIPTTAGTGSEVTRNAVINVPEQRVKVSMRGPLMLPRVALIDPELTYTMPPDVTAFTGLDALTQCLEAYVSKRRNAFAQMIALEGLRAANAIVKAFNASEAGDYLNLDNREAREQMAYAALCGGLALANSGLGAVHGFASVLGARYPVPHGACCGILLPFVVSANRVRAGDATLFTDIIDALPELTENNDLSHSLHWLNTEFNVPKLSQFGVKESDIPELVQLSKQSNSMKANPYELTDEELTGILQSAL